MKKLLRSAKTLIVLLVVTVLSLGFYAYMLLRPISYGMEYTHRSEYDGASFSAAWVFDTDNTLLITSDTYPDGEELYYYYTKGNVFTLNATTPEEFEAEVAEIEADLDAALNTPFYSAKVSAFASVSTAPDGYTATYTCVPAIIFALVCGVAELVLVALTVFAFVTSKSAPKTEEE